MVLLPAISALLGLLLGGLSRRWVVTFAVAGPLGALVVAVLLVSREPWVEPLVDTGFGGRLQPLPLATVVDGLAVSVALMVGVVATLVQIYSVAYLRDEPRYASYAAFVSLFTAAMLAVVVAGDLLLLVVGWEVMGLCSYLLIGQRWEFSEARGAAVKAFLVTKVGDLGFILGIVVLIGTTGSLLLPEAVLAATTDRTAAFVVAGLILFGVLGKSAQFPLHVWLPDAMAGPTPVSALIHAATMVAAGIYVIARLFPIYLAAPEILSVMAVVACITMLGAAVAALAQTDLKRVLAWSTVSQLAYMLAALSLGARDAAIFHLLSHAFFKALLFLAAGVVLHAVGSGALGELGGLRRLLPATFVTMSIGLLALVGVFPLAGFFSKESVLVAAEHAAHGEAEVSAGLGWLVLATSVVTIAVTAAYSLRLWNLTWLGERRISSALHPSGWLMTVPLMVLTVPTVLFGFTGLTERALPTWISASATEPVEGPAAGVALRPEVLTLVLSVVAVVLGAAGYLAGRNRAPSGLSSFAAGGFGLDALVERSVVRPFRSLTVLVDHVDDRLIGRSVSEVGRATSGVGSLVQRTQRGDVQRYVSVAMTSVVVAVVLVLVTVAT
jgi:NADH-quinone oxidoreductase subunit L